MNCKKAFSCTFVETASRILSRSSLVQILLVERKTAHPNEYFFSKTAFFITLQRLTVNSFHFKLVAGHDCAIAERRKSVRLREVQLWRRQGPKFGGHRFCQDAAVQRSRRHDDQAVGTADDRSADGYRVIQE